MSSFMKKLCLTYSRRLALNLVRYKQCQQSAGCFQHPRCLSNDAPPPNSEPPIPEYQDRGPGENERDKRARLLYQSRKRGMSENGLLLSTFADKYLNGLNTEQLKKYDSIINKHSNDWEIYYWMIGHKPTPEIYDNDVMDMLKEHATNQNRDVRIRQPDLKF